MGMRLTYCTCIVAMYTGSDLHGLNHLNRDHVLRVLGPLVVDHRYVERVLYVIHPQLWE